MAIDKQIYFPERYLQSRRYAADLVRAVSRKNSSNRDFLVPPDKATFEILADHIHDFQKVDVPGEFLLATVHECYERYGRNIFHLESNLLNEFRETDVGSIPVSSIQYPYNAFYIHFGAQEDLLIGDKLVAAGVYVAKTDLEVLLLVTGIPFVNQSDATQEVPSDFMSPVGIRIDDATLTIGEFFDASIKAQLLQIEKMHKERVLVAKTEIKTSSITESPAHVLSLRKVLDIAINAICYMTTYQDEVEVVEDQKSIQLSEQLASARSKKAQRRIKNRVETESRFSTIRFCGLSLENNNETASIAREPGSGKRPHWRRGHWRHQRSGEG